VIEEALQGGAMPTVSHSIIRAQQGPNGVKTVLDEQQVGEAIYIDAAGIPGRVVGVKDK